VVSIEIGRVERGLVVMNLLSHVERLQCYQELNSWQQNQLYISFAKVKLCQFDTVRGYPKGQESLLVSLE
jgi:hypothetical protein